jgi:hypothetical protein
MGPFMGDALLITDTKKEKVWVGTRRPGVREHAEITVTGPDASVRHYSRTPASAPGFRTFYPGVVSVTEPGNWVLRVRVGPDRMCVQARYH